MVTLEKQQEIIDLHNLGLSLRKIAEKTGISVGTISKYVHNGLQEFPKIQIDMTGWDMSEHGVPNSRLTVIKYLGNQYWECKCICNNVIKVLGRHLRNGDICSCGCLHKEIVSKNFSKDFTGKIFGKLTVLKYTGSVNKHGEKMYLCQCECGNFITVSSGHLSNGDTKSCGCMYSRGEAEIRKWLQEHNIKYIEQKTYSDLKLIKPLKFDFYLSDYNVLIEYQGIQHYNNSDFGRQQREITDKMKKEYCYVNNIELYEIKYNENISKKMEELLEREG